MSPFKKILIDIIMEREIKNAINKCSNNIKELLFEVERHMLYLSKFEIDEKYKETGNLQKYTTGDVENVRKNT